MDSAIGSTPNLDDDAADNLSEEAISKHHSYAETIGDLTGCQSLQGLAGDERADRFVPDSERYRHDFFTIAGTFAA